MRTPMARLAGVLALSLALGATPTAATPAAGGAARSQAQPVTAARAGAAARAAAPRTLEDIRIEGEIPVPQVLFITARDQRRLMDLHHRLYLKSSLEIGERTVFPAALTVVRTPVSGATREMSP